MKRTTVLLIVIFVVAVCARAQRLPEAILPGHYQVHLAPNFETAQFSGEEAIRVRVLKSTASITLNAAEIEIQEAEITSGKERQKATVTLDAPHSQATLAVGKPLAPGPAEVHLKFTGTLNDQLRGFYLVKTAKRKYAATQFEATDARRAFPCFDEPAMKATFAVSLTVDNGDTAISNGKIVSDTPGPGQGKHTLQFSTTPRMSSYLVAMAVGDFQCVEGSADEIPIRVCATPDKKDLGGFALESAQHILRYYNGYYGIKYPFGKLDLVAVPDFAAGAMENTAAIFFRESLLLIDDQHASVRAHQNVAGVLAHEMAHMWFGDLVTMKWWNDLWLNEGFATWMAPKPVASWKPEWNSGVEAVQEGISALDSDSLEATHAIRTKANTPDEILELADSITYGKAASVLRMVEAYVGEKTFQKGVNSYLKEHAYGNAAAEDFWNTLARVSGKPVDRIMASFVDQPGAPLISVRTRQEKDGTVVELAQQRFFFNRQKSDAESDGLWQVPVCMKGPATAGGGKAPVTCELLTRKQQSVTLPGRPRWVLINTDARGYYRSSYEPEALRGISGVAHAELSPGERLMFVVDGWAMVRSGKLDIGDFLTVVEGYGNERQSDVMQRVEAILRDIGRDLAQGQAEESYRGWVRKLLRPAAQELGWNPAPGEPDNRRSLRSTVLYTLGFAGRDPEVLSQARELVDEYMQDSSKVDPSIATSVVRLAALQGDAALYDRYRAHLKEVLTPEEHGRFLFGLAEFTSPELLIRTIEYALSGEVRIQSAAFLIAAVLENPAGRPATWDYVKAHWADVQRMIPAFAAPALVSSAGEVCEAASRDDVDSFLAEHKLSAAERTLRQTDEIMNQCIDLRSQQESKLAGWLEQQSSSRGH